MTTAWQSETQDAENLVTQSPYKIIGGIHPPQHKNISNHQIIQPLELAPELIFPLYYSAIESHDLLSSQDIDQAIQFGQPLSSNQIQFAHYEANPKNPNICPNNALITDIGLMDLGHLSGKQPAIKIKLQETNSEQKLEALTDWQNQPIDKLLQRIEQAGIVGLGGAMFPTAKKLRLGDQPIKTLIVNAMECEPFITCDDRLMQEQPMAVIRGALISAFICQANEIIIGIEDNKPLALKSLSEVVLRLRQQNKLSCPVKFIQVATRYPSGGEKQLIQLTTGKQVPSGQYPASLGILVQNVATLYAIKEAVIEGKLLTQRLVTITGNGINRAGNYWIAIGTPIQFIIDQLGIKVQHDKGVIIGGPLMGHKIFNLNTPIQASCNCLIFNFDESQSKLVRECIRCGQCQQVCPINLLPQELYWNAKHEQLDSLQSLNLRDCIECGACDFVCPSHIPLVDYYRFAKAKIKQQKISENRSKIAKTRFEQREARLIRLKHERNEKRQLAALEREKATADKLTDPDGKKAAIAAALQRVQEKRKSNATSCNVSNRTNDETKNKENLN